MRPGNRSLEDLPLHGDATVRSDAVELRLGPPNGGSGGVLRALLLIAAGAAAALGAVYLLHDRGREPPALVLDPSVQSAPVREPLAAPNHELDRLRADLESGRARIRTLETQRNEAVDAAAHAATQLAELRIQAATQQSASDQLEATSRRSEALERELAQEREQHRETQQLLSTARGQLAELQQQQRREPEPLSPAPQYNLELERLRRELEQARAASRRSASDLLDAQGELGREREARQQAENELTRLRRASAPASSPAAAAAPAPQPAPVVPPRLIESPAVRYPSTARVRQLEGEVLVRVLVATNGEVVEAEIERSAATGDIFDQAALQAARGCRFEPARQGGRPVRYWTRIPIRFRLRS